MRIALLVLFSLLVGFLPGFIIGRKEQAGRAAQSLPLHRAATQPIAWQDWVYPGGKSLSSIGGGGGGFSPVMLGGHHIEIVSTPNDYNTVLDYYAKKLGISAAGGGSGTTLQSSNSSVDLRSWFSQTDSQQPPGSPTSARPVQVKLLGKRTLDYDITLFITRAEGEEQTHVVSALYLKD